VAWLTECGQKAVELAAARQASFWWFACPKVVDRSLKSIEAGVRF